MCRTTLALIVSPGNFASFLDFSYSEFSHFVSFKAPGVDPSVIPRRYKPHQDIVSSIETVAGGG